MLHLQNLTLRAPELGLPDTGSAWLVRGRQLALERGPILLTAVLIVVAGWVAAQLARALLRRLLVALRLNRVLEGTRLATIIGSLGDGFGPAQLVAQLAYWTVLLITLDTAAGYLGLTGVQRALSGAVAYLPKVFSALALVSVGAYVASAAKRSVGAVLRELRSPMAGLAETAVELGTLLVVALLALDVLGVNLAFITGNLTLLLSALLVVVVFLSCWAMRHPAEELIANYYLRRMLSVGDHVQTKTHQGTVLEFVPLGLMLRDATGDEHFVPAHELVSGLRRRQGMKPD
ncbi:MAG: mechanosensitive ion channel [Myxococcales bacterium]|nr:MAG: mechanosensitive ion channel [Myxococcales bacterium]